MSIKILFVEDDPNDLKTYQSTLKRYRAEFGDVIESIEVKSKDTAIEALDDTFDGAIIDLKLIGEAGAGNGIAMMIQDHYRIPIAIFTATPADADQNINYLGVYKKGEKSYDDLFLDFLALYKTGITKIMGGRGKIEEAMNTIFWRNITPNLNTWIGHSSDGNDTENALLRYVLSHLLELLDQTEEIYFPEEMYISPPIYSGIKTGCVLKRKDEDRYSIILSPGCDLVIRETGDFKTDKVLLCDIADFPTISREALNGVTNQKKRVKRLSNLLKNNYTEYYHWLPPFSSFPGGFINFRWSHTFKKEELEDIFDEPHSQVAFSFVKDIQSRFSAYYARQGQPDFDFDRLAETMLTD